MLRLCASCAISSIKQQVDLATQQNEDDASGGIVQAEQQSLGWQIVAWPKERQNLQKHNSCHQQGRDQAKHPQKAGKEEQSRRRQKQAQPQPPDGPNPQANRRRPYALLAVRLVIADEIGGLGLGRDQAYPDRSHCRTQGIV